MKFEFSPHVAVQVKKYDEAVTFYRDVIGMEVVNSTPSESHMKCGSMNFYFENSGNGLTFFEFKVDSVEAAQKVLEDNDCVVTQTYSAKSKMFADPYGLKFHVWEE